jgi:DNA polymerase III alpha subunit
MVERAREYGMPALALSHGALFGAVDFYFAASAPV